MPGGGGSSGGTEYLSMNLPITVPNSVQSRRFSTWFASIPVSSTGSTFIHSQSNMLLRAACCALASSPGAGGGLLLPVLAFRVYQS